MSVSPFRRYCFSYPAPVTISFLDSFSCPDTRFYSARTAQRIFVDFALPFCTHSSADGLTTSFAISVGSREKVDAITEKLYEAGYEVLSGPRITGDGYYESTVLGPEDNQIEITE
jgi:hypothetical protein